MIFPRLCILENIKKNYNIKFNAIDFHIISVQHILETTGSLFESIIESGFLPNNIYLTGKIYSTHRTTFNKLRKLGINMFESSIPKQFGYYSLGLEMDIRNMISKLKGKLNERSVIIVLDDGGYCLRNVYKCFKNDFMIFGVEQTTSGIRMQKAFDVYPVIDVADSAIKKLIEPLLISESVIKKLSNYIDKSKYTKIGIIGYGNIGYAISKSLKDLFEIRVYDIDKTKYTKYEKENVVFCKSKDELFKDSEIIIGATGTDISESYWTENSNGNKVLISVSSGDIEFNKLLRQNRHLFNNKYFDPLQDLTIETLDSHKLKILRGGMVSNFTGAANSCPKKTIQITRGLLLLAIIQIVEDIDLLKHFVGPIMLNPYYQRNVVKDWFVINPSKRKQYNKDLLDGLLDINYIKSNSTGKSYKS